MITRRTFLVGTGLTAAAASPPSWWIDPAEATEPQPLKIPELIDARQRGQGISLNVQAGQTEFFPGRRSGTLGYNGSYLGPTLRVHQGDEVEIAVANKLREETTVHWHGLLIPAELDGSPHQPIAPGETWRPRLPIQQRAATLWYHSHAHHRTAEQVYGGLAGLLLVSDEDERELGLPHEYGVDDIPLVLQDRQFDDGRMVIPSGMMTLMHGRRGETLLVNGTPNPVASVPGKVVRLRLVNGSNARIFNLSFGDGREFQWIASDGGFLERAVSLKSLMLAPGERAEVLVDFSDGREIALQTETDPNAPMMMGMMGRLRSAVSGIFDENVREVLRFQPTERGDTPATLPDRLMSWQSADDSAATRKRRVTLTMGMGGMMGGGMMGAGGMFGINGKPFEMDFVNERANSEGSRPPIPR